MEPKLKNPNSHLIALVTGAASGLGYSFLKGLSETCPASSEIFAIDRDWIDRDSLSLRAIGPSTHIVDITSKDSIETFNKLLGLETPVHLLIHSVGVRGLVPDVERKNPDEVAKAESLAVMDKGTAMKTFEINTVGTLQLLQTMIPHLKRGSTPEKPAKVVIMGSRMGSMSYNTTGGAYAYRASKAALNAIIKSVSIDVPEVIFTVLHPGRVESGLVKCREEGAIEPDESVADMMKVIENLTLEDSGKFFDRFGEPIGW